jgi:hypothetical protein
MVPKAWKDALWFGRCQHNKKQTNKQPSLTEKFQSGGKQITMKYTSFQVFLKKLLGAN